MCLVLRSGIEDFKFAQEDMRCFKLLNMRNGQLTSPIFDKSCYENIGNERLSFFEDINMSMHVAFIICFCKTVQNEYSFLFRYFFEFRHFTVCLLFLE